MKKIAENANMTHEKDVSLTIQEVVDKIEKLQSAIDNFTSNFNKDMFENLLFRNENLTKCFYEYKSRCEKLEYENTMLQSQVRGKYKKIPDKPDQSPHILEKYVSMHESCQYLQQQINDLHSSYSWKVTAPFRGIRNALARFFHIFSRSLMG